MPSARAGGEAARRARPPRPRTPPPRARSNRRSRAARGGSGRSPRAAPRRARAGSRRAPGAGGAARHPRAGASRPPQRRRTGRSRARASAGPRPRDRLRAHAPHRGPSAPARARRRRRVATAGPTAPREPRRSSEAQARPRTRGGFRRSRAGEAAAGACVGGFPGPSRQKIALVAATEAEAAREGRRVLPRRLQVALGRQQVGRVTAREGVAQPLDLPLQAPERFHERPHLSLLVVRRMNPGEARLLPELELAYALAVLEKLGLVARCR